MRVLRFLSVRLSYGCHSRGFVLPETEGPVVVVGPNGAGKSTLIEGLVRTLFGFNRRAAADGREIEWRQPWGGGPAQGCVELRDAEGKVVVIEREFTSNDVTITTAGGPTESWRGDGNPAATNASACDYRQRLAALIGFERLDSYELTAFVRQGGLLATRVDQSLLRAAAGSPIDVERALGSIEQDYRRFTREPVGPGRGRGQKPREREELAERIQTLGAGLATTRAAERARAPLVAEQERLRRLLAENAASIDALESAQLVLARREALDVESKRLEERIETNERRIAEVDQSRAELAAARARLDESGGGIELPEDFTERAAALEQLWPTRERMAARCAAARRSLEAMSIPSAWWWAAAAMLAVVGGAAAFRLDEPGWAVAGVAASAVLAAVVFLQRRTALARRAVSAQALADLESELEDTESAIERRLEGIPPAIGLAPATLPVHRAAHLRRREVVSAYTHAQGTHRATLRRIASALGSRTSGSVEEELIDVLQSAVTRDRNERAEKRLRFEDLSGIALELPAGVSHDLRGIQQLLSLRRSERANAEQELRAATERLAELRPSLGAATVESELAALRERLGEIDEAAEATRVAYELLDQAHQGFRRDDQRRLLGCISTHLLHLSQGTLGPLEAALDLETARLRAFGRDVPLDFPPLSYGQLHLVLLAVRLGAADFMSQWGQAVPLIVDEPFANLDEENAAAVWKQLSLVARERQVLIATQETSLLARLGVPPDVELGGGRPEPRQAPLTRLAGA